MHPSDPRSAGKPRYFFHLGIRFECTGCGACVASCPNASAMLFTSAKVSQLALLPQGKPEAARRALSMLRIMEQGS